MLLLLETRWWIYLPGLRVLLTVVFSLAQPFKKFKLILREIAYTYNNEIKLQNQ